MTPLILSLSSVSTMPNLLPSSLIELSASLNQALNSDDKFQRLLSPVRKAIPCDAVVLLALQGDHLKPIALEGLSHDTLGRRFLIEEHPRFAEICQSRFPVRFETESTLPDPYDGLLMAREGDLPVHSCMGLPLWVNENLIGLLTLDSLTPNEFDHIPSKTLEVISTLVSASLKTALTLDYYERNASHAQALVEDLTQQALTKDGGELIGKSSAMRKLKEEIQMVASSDFTTLINGETGVGKELVARTLHQQSRRCNGPLVYVNCAALPETLVESELFGHVKGAFTGANQNREGKFTLANGGSIFLDEIGEIPLSVQSKLLRVIQNQEIQPVGQDSTRKVDVRIITATNRDLSKEVELGNFRSDLFHRLSVYPIHAPALRERREDIALLAGYFIELTRRKLGIQQIKFSNSSIPYLQAYDWPGNVRELEHCINRAALKAHNTQRNKKIITIQPEHIGELANPIISIENEKNLLHKNTTPAAPDLGLREATEQFQRSLILDALEQTQTNWAAAARLLKTDRGNLHRLAKRLNISVTKHVNN